MYNLNSHYENVFRLLQSIIAYPRVLYLHPFGSTQPENIEVQAGFIPDDVESPLFIFYDQEPIYGEFNYRLFDYIRDNFRGPHILVTTEKNSGPLNGIKDRYGWPTVYYFHHIFAAHDWFRGYKYDARLIEPPKRKLKKKYITFNRLTSSARVYRSLLISELVKANILSEGYVSYSDTCPDGGDYSTELKSSAYIDLPIAQEAIRNISSLDLPLRIDFQDSVTIPNQSFVLSAVKETQESFCYVVTETCYWEQKYHLTEKIFKPIVSKMPFILVGPANNLKYLRSYGFKTFDRWWDESYDEIEDPIKRLRAITKVLKQICSKNELELADMLKDMDNVLQHNYSLFNSQQFLDAAWHELKTNLIISCAPN